MHDLIDGALPSGTGRLAEVALLGAAIAAAASLVLAWGASPEGSPSTPGWRPTRSKPAGRAWTYLHARVQARRPGQGRRTRPRGRSGKLPNVRYALITVGAVLLILATVMIVRQPGIPA